MTPAKRITHNNDEGICEYRNCHRDIPDGISIQLCNKHLELAFAAYLIANPGKLR